MTGHHLVFALLLCSFGMPLHSNAQAEEFEYFSFYNPNISYNEVTIAGFSDRGRVVGNTGGNQDGYAYDVNTGAFMILGSGTPVAYHNRVTALSSTDVTLGYQWRGNEFKDGRPIRWLTGSNRTYSISTLGLGEPSFNGINRFGSLIGCCDQQGFHFLHVGESTIEIDPPASSIVSLVALNDSNTVVGNFSPIGGNVFAGFIYSNGGYTIVQPIGYYTVIEALASNDTIGGYYYLGSGSKVGFIQKDGIVTTLNHPGADNTTVLGVNSQGDAVGIWTPLHAKRTKGFLYRRGRFSPMNYPGATSTTPTAINSHGDIVGTYTGVAGESGQYGFAAVCPSGQGPCE